MDATRLLNSTLYRCVPLLLAAASSVSAQLPLPDPMRPALPIPPSAAASPALPSTAPPGPHEASPAVQPQPQPRLQGIVRSGSWVRVLVDGRLLTPGTVSGPYRVLSVHQNGIELQWQGRTMWLSLYPDVARSPRPQSPAPALPSPARSSAPPTDKTAANIAAEN